MEIDAQLGTIVMKALVSQYPALQDWLAPTLVCPTRTLRDLDQLPYPMLSPIFVKQAIIARMERPRLHLRNLRMEVTSVPQATTAPVRRTRLTTPRVLVIQSPAPLELIDRALVVFRKPMIAQLVLPVTTAKTGVPLLTLCATRAGTAKEVTLPHARKINIARLVITAPKVSNPNASQAGFKTRSVNHLAQHARPATNANILT